MKKFQPPFQHSRLKKVVHFKQERHRFDKFLIGFILGLIAPIIGIIIAWSFMYADYPLSAVFKWFYSFNSPSSVNRLSKLISLGMIINLIPFFLLLNKKRYQAAKGIIIASFIYLILVFIYLFILQ